MAKKIPEQRVRGPAFYYLLHHLQVAWPWKMHVSALDFRFPRENVPTFSFTVGLRVRWNVLGNQKFSDIVTIFLSSRILAAQSSLPISSPYTAPNHTPHAHEAVTASPFLHWMSCLLHAREHQSVPCSKQRYLGMYHIGSNWENCCHQTVREEITTQFPWKRRRGRNIT